MSLGYFTIYVWFVCYTWVMGLLRSLGLFFRQILSEIIESSSSEQSQKK